MPETKLTLKYKAVAYLIIHYALSVKFNSNLHLSTSHQMRSKFSLKCTASRSKLISFDFI